LFHGQTFEMRQIACVFKGWYCDGDQPAESIINLDMKLECSDVTVWSAYYHAEADRSREESNYECAMQECETHCSGKQQTESYAFSGFHISG
jgi:hypothetical protein